MQRVNCTLRLSGDVLNTVEKTNISPAEIVILNDLHGEGAVINIKPTQMDKVPHRQERERLAGIYGHHVVDRIFPGEFNKLPSTLADIEGKDEGEEDDDADADADADNDANKQPGNKDAEEEGEEDDASNGQDGNADEVDEDDKELVAAIEGANSKDALRAIAKENEVDLTGVEDKMVHLKSAIYTALKIPAPKPAE